MSKRVVITGVGAVTPIGNTADEFWHSLLKGKSGTGRVSQVDPDLFSSKVSAEVKNFDPLKYLDPKTAKKTDRFVHLSLASGQMAFDDSKIDFSKLEKERAGVVLGSGIGGLKTIEIQHTILLQKGVDRVSPFMIPMMIVNIAAGHLSIRFGLKGPNTCVTTACASATHAIGDAFRIIQRDEADLMLTGGTEACITNLGFGGFDAMKALSTLNDPPEKASRPFDAERSGFVMGEGAGILVLEEMEHAKKRGAKIYCEVVGYGLTSDANHITAPDLSGDGPARCMTNALKNTGLKPSDITYINAHGTSTPLNDSVETLAIKKAFGDHSKKVMVSSTKSMTGHLLGAAGGIEAIVCALAIKESKIPPTINYSKPDPQCDLDYVPNQAREVKVHAALSNSLGFGGHNACIAFKEFKE